MTNPKVSEIDLAGHKIRIWSKGDGPRLGYLAGIGGLTRWPQFLDRLAERFTVIVPSLPGFPGGGRLHETLDSHLDWLVATRDILVAAGLDGAPLIGASAGGALAADIAALWPESVSGLVLISPFGLFDEATPTADPFAQRPGHATALLTEDAGRWDATREEPHGADPIEWKIEMTRANTAAARLLWPLGDTGLIRRLARITAPTLLIWGDRDRVIPVAYAGRFISELRARSELRTIVGAGHLADFDRPDEVAEQTIRWLA